MRALTIAGVLLAVTAGCAAAQGKLVISSQVWAGYQSYLSSITNAGNGFFAVSTDGRGWDGIGCKPGQCIITAAAEKKALEGCSRASAGQSCIIFAKGLDIVVPYEVAQ